MTTRRRLAPRPAGEEGISLVEVIVSLMVLALFSAGISAMLGETLHRTRLSRQRQVAAGLVSRDLEQVRAQVKLPGVAAQGLTSLTFGVRNTQSALSVDGTVYTLTRAVSWTTDGATGNACQSTNSSAAPAYLHVATTANWPGETVPVSSDTVVSVLDGSVNPLAGNLAVQVVGADGTTPVVGATVSLSAGPDSPSPQITGSDGCAFFAFLTPGTYTASVSRPGGYVDVHESPTATVPGLVVTQAQTTHAPDVRYDVSTGIVPTFAYDPGHAPVPGLGVTLVNALLNGGAPFSTAAANLAGLQTIFPFPGSLQVYPTSCGGPGSPFTPVTVTPALTPGGAAQTVTLPLTSVDLTLTATSANKPVYVVGAVNGSPALGCLDGGGASLLGSGAAGAVLRFSLPPGTWFIGTDTTTNFRPVTVTTTPLAVTL